MMTRSSALLLALACAPAAAQSPVTLMPEGSKDVAIGLALWSGPKAEGSARRGAAVAPFFSVRWSNGVFLDGLTLGMQLSSEPHLQYGPIVSLDLDSTRDDIPAMRSRRTLVAGAFVRYQLLYNVSLESRISYGAAPGGGGLLLNARASYGMNVAPRQYVVASVGVGLASADYMQAEFGLTPEQAGATGRQPHEASGGMRNMQASARWNWQVSRKYTVGTSVTLTRLQGSAAASPITEQRSAVSYVTSLTYQF